MEASRKASLSASGIFCKCRCIANSSGRLLDAGGAGAVPDEADVEGADGITCCGESLCTTEEGRCGLGFADLAGSTLARSRSRLLIVDRKSQGVAINCNVTSQSKHKEC